MNFLSMSENTGFTFVVGHPCDMFFRQHAEWQARSWIFLVRFLEIWKSPPPRLTGSIVVDCKAWPVSTMHSVSDERDLISCNKFNPEISSEININRNLHQCFEIPTFQTQPPWFRQELYRNPSRVENHINLTLVGVIVQYYYLDHLCIHVSIYQRNEFPNLDHILQSMS